MSELEKYLTVTEAAKIRGVSRQAIVELITRGRLKATKVGSQWLMKKSAITRFRPLPVGRPRKVKK